MLFSNHTFIGIDPTAGRRPFTYVALDSDLKLLALGACPMDEVLAFAAGQRSAAVAVCAPRRPNQGLMQRPEVRQSLNPQPKPGRWKSFRVAEYELRQHNIPSPQTYADEDACPNWMRMGFNLFRRLDSVGYSPYPGESPLLSLEVYPHACFTALLGVIPLPKYSLEGRIQRQLVLHENDLHITDPMNLFEEITRHRLLQGKLDLSDVYQPAELDAMVAAYTAWLSVTRPQNVSLLGSPEDGQMVLPVSELKRRY